MGAAAVLGGEDHPLLAAPQGAKRLIVLITTDRGLAGPLNTNAIRFVAKEITEHKGDLAVVTVGRKGRDAMRRNRVPIEAHFAGFGDKPKFADVLPVARLITDDFLSGDYGRVDIVYSRFVSTLSQRPEVIQLLPIEPPEAARQADARRLDYIFEPDPQSILEQLLPRYIEVLIYQAILETAASFFSAQMVAMRNATDNANDLVQSLSLTYNKVRQANITNQVTEIASAISTPERVVGMHFFNPAPIMKLVEVVSTVSTGADVAATVTDLCRKIGKHPVACGDRAGFIANALLFGYLNHAARMFEQRYATREDLDAAMRYGCGYPMGPFTLLDFVGLDTTYYIADIMFEEYREKRLAPPPLLKQMVLAGRLGRKSGRGFYEHGKK